MKKIIVLIIISFTFYNCSSVYTEKVIPYSVSIESENSIYHTIESLNQNNISFYFETLEDNKFKIHLITDGINGNYFFSNRKLFVNDKFYPLVFDTDYKFFVRMKDNYPIISKFEDDTEKKSTVIKMPEIEERVKNINLYLKDSKRKIIDSSTYWVVDVKGNLLETNAK